MCLEPEESLIAALSQRNGELWKVCSALEAALNAPVVEAPVKARARYYRDAIFSLMERARSLADELETMTAADYWPFPTYAELLFHA